MHVRTAFGIAMALVWAAAWSPAGAQGVYKCGYRSYSQQPCSKHGVDTGDAPVPARSARARQLEQRRLLARSLRRQPDESAADFEKRRRWTRLLPADGEECARLDKRMPVEEARLTSPVETEVQEAAAAVAQTKKRSRELRC